MAERLVTPTIQGRDVRGLTREAFTVAPQKPRIIGDYGRRGGVDPVRYLMPAQFDRSALYSMTPEELALLGRQASEQYDVLEQSWRTVLPEGYTGIYDDGAGGLQGPDPMTLPENQERQQALTLLNQIQGNASAVRGELEQDRLRGENQLFAGAVEAGYEFAPGALNDANVRAAIWENRNNPKYFETAAARNFSRNTADPYSRHAAEQRAFTVADLAKMGVGLPGYGATGQQTNVIGPGGVSVRHDDSLLPPQAMPYNPADPLSEAAYYGGQSGDPNAIVGRQLDPTAPIGDSPLTNPDDWEPDPTYNPADGRMDMRYRRKLRPYGVDDRIVRPAGDTRYGNLRPGFYSAGSITGPQDVSRVGPAPTSTLMRAPRIRSAPTIVGRTGVM